MFAVYRRLAAEDIVGRTPSAGVMCAQPHALLGVTRLNVYGRYGRDAGTATMLLIELSRPVVRA